jgi:hypothetical protein
MSPSVPHSYATIKLLKNKQPIRPIVNWKDSPNYKLARFLAKIFVPDILQQWDSTCSTGTRTRTQHIITEQDKNLEYTI